MDNLRGILVAFVLLFVTAGCETFTWREENFAPHGRVTVNGGDNYTFIHKYENDKIRVIGYLTYNFNMELTLNIRNGSNEILSMKPGSVSVADVNVVQEIEISQIKRGSGTQLTKIDPIRPSDINRDVLIPPGEEIKLIYALDAGKISEPFGEPKMDYIQIKINTITLGRKSLAPLVYDLHRAYTP